MTSNNYDHSRIEQFVKELNSCIIPNYDIISDIFNIEYGYSELDPIRDEICKCIICGFYQATITLTNHLLEKSLKFCLLFKYDLENKAKDVEMGDYSTEAIDKYDRLSLNETIKFAFGQKLITSEQEKVLKQYKNDFRNSYSHANTDIIKDTFVYTKRVTTNDLENIEEFFKNCFDDSSYTKIPSKNSMAQGMVQVENARDRSIPYFRKVDEIIRNMLFNLTQ
jgi:hypothetical protein